MADPLGRCDTVQECDYLFAFAIRVHAMISGKDGLHDPPEETADFTEEGAMPGAVDKDGG
jgi:hypothetical protein